MKKIISTLNEEIKFLSDPEPGSIDSGAKSAYTEVLSWLNELTPTDLIEEIQDYFKAKILSGDFTVNTIDEYAAEITIDESYDFAIWISNASTCQPYKRSQATFMYIPDFSEEEIAKCWSIMEPIVVDYNARELRTKKLEQYNKLKSELETEGVIQ